jgi:hypothetical protein
MPCWRPVVSSYGTFDLPSRGLKGLKHNLNMFSSPSCHLKHFGHIWKLVHIWSVPYALGRLLYHLKRLIRARYAFAPSGLSHMRLIDPRAVRSILDMFGLPSQHLKHLGRVWPARPRVV